MTDLTRAAATDVDIEKTTPSTKLDAVSAEVFAGEAHLGGDTAAAFAVDVAPDTHHPNEVELRVDVDGLEVLVGLDKTTLRQLRDVLDERVLSNKNMSEHDSSEGGRR